MLSAFAQLGEMGGTSYPEHARNPPAGKANVAITVLHWALGVFPKILLKHLHTEALAQWRALLGTGAFRVGSMSIPSVARVVPLPT